MPALPTWPTEADDRRLVAELLAGRASAPGEIAAAFLAPLANHLRRDFPRTDPDLCESAAGDAILSLVKGKTRYDPARATLGVFLRFVARRRLLNLLACEERHRGGIPLGFVAEPAAGGNVGEDGDSPGWDDPRLLAEIAALGPSELVVFRLMRDGVRDNRVFAAALELPDASPAEWAAGVKRYKDRIRKRLSRAVGGAE